jgi:AcrR family transcriptional regulator
MQDAFLELISTRSLEEISIKEICDAAGLSYPTFYRRFSGKDELLAGIATEEVRRLLASGLSAREHQIDGGSASAMCGYIEAQRPLWCILLTGGAANAMRQEFMRLSREFAETQPRANPWLAVDLAVPFVAGGIFEVLAWWMKQPDNYPTGNVVKLLDVLIIDTTARSRDIDLL